VPGACPFVVVGGRCSAPVGARTKDDMGYRYTPGRGLELRLKIDDRVSEWLRQRAADEGTTVTEIVRRALDRELVANPLTTGDEATAGVLDYLREMYGLGGSSVTTTVGEDDGEYRRRVGRYGRGNTRRR
jgi:hypothetical protein